MLPIFIPIPQLVKGGAVKIVKNIAHPTNMHTLPSKAFEVIIMVIARTISFFELKDDSFRLPVPVAISHDSLL
jgi:hypothetical protein